MIIPFATSASAKQFSRTLFNKELDDNIIQPSRLYGTVDTYGGDLDSLTEGWSSIIGIVTAIVGNILISIALNTQRYAHIRQAREWKEEKEEKEQHSLDGNIHDRGPTGADIGEDRKRGKKNDYRIKDDENENQNGHRNIEYGTTETQNRDVSKAKARTQHHSATKGSMQHSLSANNRSMGEIPHESAPLLSSSRRRVSANGLSGGENGDAAIRKKPGNNNDGDDASSGRSSNKSNSNSGEPDEKNYLRSPYWWLGIVLMVIGEGGNFLAYGFAPASIVSPLGVVALISNCIIAPFMLKEPFRKRDFFGVIVAIAGAVTVVLSANNSNPKLGPNDIWHRIKTWEFETYLVVTLTIIFVLTVASNKYGEKSILIDLGLAGLIGGYTVLSTKGVASLLSYTLWRALTFPVTYLFIVILAGSAVMQIKHVNRALQRFDSTRVIPTQFVLFTLSVILGSAILYRDFERTSGQAAAKFIGGCVLTFIGVYLLTTGNRSQHDSASESENDGSQEDELDSEEEQDSQHSIPYSHGRRSTAKDQLRRFASGSQLESRSRPKAQASIVASSRRTSSFTPGRTRTNSQPLTVNGENLRHWSPEENDDGTSNPSYTSVDRFTGPMSSNIANRALIPSVAATAQPLPPPLKTAISVPIMPVGRQGVSRPTTPSAQAGVSTSPDQAKKLSRRSVAGIVPGPLTSPLSSPLSVLVADSRRRGIELESPRRLRPKGPLRLAVTTYPQSRAPMIGESSTNDRHRTFSQADESFADGATVLPRE